MNGSRQRLANISVKQWLDELGQSEQMQNNFWNPMALATLNERPEIASADMFAESNCTGIHAKKIRFDDGHFTGWIK